MVSIFTFFKNKTESFSFMSTVRGTLVATNQLKNQVCASPDPKPLGVLPPPTAPGGLQSGEGPAGSADFEAGSLA